MKPFQRKGLMFIGLIVVLELVLRLFGFGEVPLYYESPKYEYAIKPSQNISRFGNEFFINEEGMRSAQLRPTSLRVLKFGDSVLNGGVATDQEDLASTIIEKELSESFGNIQVLNVSAGSWEPDNAYAWMQEHGSYNAKLIVLVFSSHDWKKQMSFQRVVGNVSFYPENQPFLAIFDAVNWLSSRFLFKTPWEDLPIQSNVDISTGEYNSGWKDFADYSVMTNTPLLVYHHPNLEEFRNGTWNEDGQELEAFLKLNRVKTVSGLEASYNAEDYRDLIHPNEKGQGKIAKKLILMISRELRDNGF